MNSFNVIIKCSWITESFATCFTFVIFLSFMNNFDMPFVKKLSLRLTLRLERSFLKILIHKIAFRKLIKQTTQVPFKKK